MSEPNEVLAACLEELGWSPRTLAHQINRIYRDGTLSDTAPYHWRDAGKVPRAPVASLAAQVLSAALGRRVTVDALWHGRAQESPLLQLASSGMDDDWSVDGTMRVVSDWLSGSMIDRRFFMAVSGATLARAVWAYVNDEMKLASTSAATGTREAPDSLIDQIEQSVPMLQALDDVHGGAAHLGYVGAQMRAVALVLNEGSYGGAARQRLLIALADLAQLAGWKAFDALQHGLAQRYFFTALRAANTAGYQTMAAHTLADLAVQAVARDETRDAVSLGEAATRQVTSASAGVRACVRSRLAHAYAANGQIVDFERETADALEDVDGRNPDADPLVLPRLRRHLDVPPVPLTRVSGTGHAMDRCRVS